MYIKYVSASVEHIEFFMRIFRIDVHLGFPPSVHYMKYEKDIRFSNFSNRSEWVNASVLENSYLYNCS